MDLRAQLEGKGHKLMQVPGSSKVRSLINQRKAETTGIGKEEGQSHPCTLHKLRTVRT